MLPKPLIFAQWDAGIMDSAYEGIKGGFASIVGLDYRTYPGILQVERPMLKVSGQSGGSDVVNGFVKWIINLGPESDYALCDEQAVGTTGYETRILRTENSGATWSLFKMMGTSDSPFNANGGIFWKNYFLFASDKHLGYYKPGTTWVLDWQSFHTATDTGGNDIDWHPMWQGQRDGSLYIGCGRYVALLVETAGKTFDPTDATTYSFTYNALDIPSDFRIKSFAEVGDYLMLGCWKKVGTKHYPVAVLYPWNYVIRPLSHEAPLFKNKLMGVSAQLNIDNVLYSWLGSKGEIFYYNGSEFRKLKRLSKNDGIGTLEIRPGAVKEFNDMAYFGVDNAPTYTPAVLGGIYQYGSHDKAKYPPSINLPYPLSLGQSAAHEIYSLGVAGLNDQILLAGWYIDGANSGIDQLDTSTRLSQGAYFETMLMQLGTVKDKAKIDKFEIYLDGPLAANQGIDIKYRRKASGSWIQIGEAGGSTFSYTNDGAVSEKYIPFNINNIVNLQFKVNFYTSGDTTPLLKTILCQ